MLPQQHHHNDAFITMLRQWREEEDSEKQENLPIAPFRLIQRKHEHHLPGQIALLLSLSISAFLAGILIGTLIFGPWWFSQWNCLRGMPLPLPPRQFAVCQLPHFP